MGEELALFYDFNSISFSQVQVQIQKEHLSSVLMQKDAVQR